MTTSAPFQYRSAESGLTEEIVRNVVFLFYEKIRRDPVLGPVFTGAIGADWDSHIERIILFWLTVTKLGRGYDARNFMQAHLRHRSIRIAHIPRWLELFKQAAGEKCPPEGASVLVDIAERMAENIELGLAKRDSQ